MAKTVAGTTYVKADSEQFSVTGGVECPLSSEVKEPIDTPVEGEAYNKRMHITPYVKLTAVNDAAMDYEKIATADDMTVVVEFPNGRVYTLTEAYLSGETVVKADDGTTDYVFHGAKGVWS
jgi:hypothetical protein